MDRILTAIEKHVIEGKELTSAEADHIASIAGEAVLDLFAAANRIRGRYRGPSVDLCAVINAKSGACSEDCAYCAQSSHGSADIRMHPLLDREPVLAKAAEAREGGARRFCIVTSGRRASDDDIGKICSMVREVRDLGLLPCATLGLLSRDELSLLRDSGLERYHNNIETSERFFPSVCTTHTYGEKVRTLEAAREVGLSICSGGIFGLGETWDDRIRMAFALREIDPDSVPINFLIPVKGTRMDSRGLLPPIEALKIISLFRLALPGKEIRVCGGRTQTLREFTSMVFFAGADGLLIGNYLTTPGRDYQDDLWMIEQSGLQPGQ